MACQGLDPGSYLCLAIFCYVCVGSREVFHRIFDGRKVLETLSTGSNPDLQPNFFKPSAFLKFVFSTPAKFISSELFSVQKTSRGKINSVVFPHFHN